MLADNRKIIGGDSRQLLYLPIAPDRGAGSAADAPSLELIAPTVTATPEEPTTARKARSAGRNGGSR